MSHATLHVGFGALNVIVEVVSKKLDATDGFPCLVWRGKMAGEEDKGNIADVLGRG